MTLTTAQLNQLRLLAVARALSASTAVDRFSCGQAVNRALDAGLDMRVLGGVLYAREFVDRVDRPAKHGEPRRRLYFLTPAGIEHLRTQHQRGRIQPEKDASK